MSSEWETSKLLDLLAIKPRNGLYKAKKFQGSGHRWLKMKDVFGNNFIRNQKMELITVTNDEIEKFGCVKGDLLFGRTSLTLEGVGDCALVEEINDIPIFESNLFRLRFDIKKADPKFFFYYFKSSLGKDAIQSIAKQTAATSITASDLVELHIPIPSRNVQSEIARFLGCIDDRIALLRETNATLEAIAQALFKSWFVDFDPVHANAAFIENGQAPNLPAEIQALFPSRFVESPQGLIPEGWEWRSLGDAYEINPKRQLKKGTVANYLDMASVQTQGHVTADVNVREFGSGTKFCNGDTLLARITPCLENGKTAFVDFLEPDEIGWGSTEFVVLKPKTPLPDFHGYLLARQPLFRDFAIRSMSGTSGRQRVQSDVLGSFNLAIPDKEVAEAFNQIATPIQQSISANHKKAQTLANLRDTLLPRLISGQLRLPEAGAELAAVIDN
ncbi:restriction endonuclease subunit S [Rheinheimera sp. D18]|uniref:restriction endonuclease subunit S n=1 Tax=Rheinheimera sp. D18 TaxID=2545632 RepID=UPI0010512B8C|nr:restriction endonuclease subunit S [Rheinheimera sp. D18]QBL08851.1 restriction endonuclease subunit S [Rheinheimera sp. D18]